MEKKLAWFSDTNCESIELKNYKRLVDKNPNKTKKIVDKNLIKKIILMIDQLPTNGNEMKSFGDDVSHLVVEFSCKGKLQSVEFYRGRIKTPSTGFYDDKNENEDTLFHFLSNLLEK